jgi:hypothetical protein
MATMIPRGLLAVVLGALLSVPPVASAATVTVGSPLTASFTGGGLDCAPSGCTTFNSALGEPGAHVSTPVSGTIVRWRMRGAPPTVKRSISLCCDPPQAGSTQMSGPATRRPLRAPARPPSRPTFR